MASLNTRLFLQNVKYDVYALNVCLESRSFSQHFEVKQPQHRPTTDVRKERFRMTFYRVNSPRDIQVDGFSNW